VHPEIRKVSPRPRATLGHWVRTSDFANFLPLSHRISETVPDKTKVSIKN